MSEDEKRVAMAEWLKTRPECVQKLAAEFPPGTIILMEGKEYFVFGWTEDDRIIATIHNPTTDVGYAMAMASNVRFCASHFRGQED